MSNVFIFSRADTRSVTRSEARSYNETIIRPVTRRLNTPAGTSYRSSRSHATTSEVSKKYIENKKEGKHSTFLPNKQKGLVKWTGSRPL